MTRPRVYDAEEVTQALTEYINSTENPMIQEFCSRPENPVPDTLNRLSKEYKPLSDAIKRMHQLQQARTVNLVESGQMNPIWAIFKLKQPQYGWTDKQQVESINLNIDTEVSEVEADRILKASGIKLIDE